MVFIGAYWEWYGVEPICRILPDATVTVVYVQRQSSNGLTLVYRSPVWKNGCTPKSSAWLRIISSCVVLPHGIQ